MENFTNKQINFDILKERAHNLRWAEVPDGVIPLTAADHDFPCAPEVVEALTDYIKDGYFPYIENRGMERFKEDLAKSFRERKNEPVEAKYVLPIDSAARGMQVIADAFLQPGDECLLKGSRITFRCILSLRFRFIVADQNNLIRYIEQTFILPCMIGWI